MKRALGWSLLLWLPALLLARTAYQIATGNWVEAVVTWGTSFLFAVVVAGSLWAASRLLGGKRVRP